MCHLWSMCAPWWGTTTTTPWMAGRQIRAHRCHCTVGGREQERNVCPGVARLRHSLLGHGKWQDFILPRSRYKCGISQCWHGGREKRDRGRCRQRTTCLATMAVLGVEGHVWLTVLAAVCWGATNPFLKAGGNGKRQPPPRSPRSTLDHLVMNTYVLTRTVSRKNWLTSPLIFPFASGAIHLQAWILSRGQAANGNTC